MTRTRAAILGGVLSVLVGLGWIALIGLPPGMVRLPLGNSSLELWHWRVPRGIGLQLVLDGPNVWTIDISLSKRRMVASAVVLVGVGLATAWWPRLRKLRN